MIDRKTYLILPGDYKTLKSDFLGNLGGKRKRCTGTHRLRHIKSGQDSLYHFSPVCAY